MHTMSQERDNSLVKVEQARHSLELMKRVWDSQTPVLPGYTAEQEYAYFLSAFMNACFSATCMFDEGSHRNQDMVSFRKKHTDFYLHGTGYRHKDTHSEPVIPQGKDYKPPNGNGVNFQMEEQTSAPAWNEVNWVLKKDLYFLGKSEQTITQRCSEHLLQVRDFIQQNFL
jgi:hypothetical protein